MMDKDAKVMATAVLLGGSKVGFSTNPDTKNRPTYIKVNGEKVVCFAQGGECRYNEKFYTPGLGDAKSWKTPIIDETCPNECTYKMLVCDNHPKGECPSSIEYFPEYNKFRGQFARYCSEFSRLEKKAKKQK